MAEFAAHLNQSIDASKPTIFEVVAQESMTSILRPAVEYTLRILLQQNPCRFRWLYQRRDELYTLLEILVQNHHLKQFGASFSEHFYGLKRCTISQLTSSGFQVTKQKRVLSLIALVLFPYLKLKLDKTFENWRDEYAEGVPRYFFGMPFAMKLKYLFMHVYPVIHMAWEVLHMIYYLMYVLNFVDVHSPMLHIIRLRLARLTREDILAQNIGHYPTFTTTSQSTLLQKLTRLPKDIFSRGITLFANSLPVLVFFLKFVEWWYSSENATVTAAVTNLPVPPPPGRPKVAEYGVDLPVHPAQCPLCTHIRTNPTVLSSSGYVFCYTCIYKHLQKYAYCPVTHLPSSTEQLIRIYSSPSS